MRYFKSQSGRGFNIIELVVITAIIAVLFGAVVANLKEGEKGRNVKLAADSVQSALRQMQNNILSGQVHSVSGKAAGSYGFKITNSGTSYTTFVEELNKTAYAVLETVNLPNKISITNLVVDGNASTSLEVRFYPPFGKIKMDYVKLAGGSVTDAENVQASFDLVYQGTSHKKTIVIDGISGRIEMQ